MRESIMWKTMWSAAVLVGLSSLPVVVGLAVANESGFCTAPLSSRAMSTADATRIGESLGYTITKAHPEDGCYRLTGRDRNGANVELTLDPYSGKILPETKAKS
jgi:hypothetical protein